MADSRDLYKRAVVVDAAAPLAPFGAIPLGVEPDDLVNAYTSAGVTLAVFTVVDDFPNSIEQTLKLIAANRSYLLARPERFLLSNTAYDVRRAKAQRKLAVAFAFQGTNALLGDLTLIEAYRRLDVIQMLLAYNSANLVADGCHESRNAGLSAFGRRVVAEMNRVGMILDLSHVGLRSSLEALELSTKPPVFSHSTPKKFAAHDRNIADEQIRACAAKDGLVGLTGLGLFMDAVHRRASVERLADTVDYVVQLVGPKHAGIGLDYLIDTRAMARYLRANTSLYGGASQYPSDGLIESVAPSVLPALAEELARRGYSDEHVLAVLGENYLRVLEGNESP